MSYERGTFISPGGIRLGKINDKTINFVMSDKAEIGSAGEQPIRNNLADWNDKEVGKLPTSNSQNIPVTFT